MAVPRQRELRVPYDARGWSQLDARWREGLLAGFRLLLPNGQLGRVLGDGGVVLEELVGGARVVAPASRSRGTPA